MFETFVVGKSLLLNTVQTIVVIVFHCVYRVTVSAVTWQMNRAQKWRHIRV